jgi:hypothetical protein
VHDEELAAEAEKIEKNTALDARASREQMRRLIEDTTPHLPDSSSRRMQIDFPGDYG